MEKFDVSRLQKADFCNNDKVKERFYSGTGLRYFLYEYELHLQEQINGDTKVLWNHVNQETIEHIYPRTPAEGCWNDFPQDAEKYLHNLGNLLLLSRAMNSALQNRSFAEKKRKHYTSGSYSAIKIAAENEDWTPQTIERRKEELLDFLWQRWGLSEGYGEE